MCHSFLSASNGNPRLPDSLHYIDPTGRPNAYQRVRNRSLLQQFSLTSFWIYPSDSGPLLFRQSLRLERCCSFMTQTSGFLPGDLEHDQSMVQSHIVST